MFRICLLVAAGLMVSGAALAEPQRTPTAVHVSIKDVNFADKDDVAKLYQRLRDAAEDACTSDLDTPNIRTQDRACAIKALDDAVAATHQPMLLALHRGDRNLTVASSHP